MILAIAVLRIKRAGDIKGSLDIWLDDRVPFVLKMKDSGQALLDARAGGNRDGAG